MFHVLVYQGRFKSFPVESDEHFYAVVRYVERNALRAGLVERAEDWPWGSLHHRARKAGGPDWSPALLAPQGLAVIRQPSQATQYMRPSP